MIFNTIRSSVAVFTSIAITLACVVVMAVALTVHEELYLNAVKDDLDGLSSNLANDLLQIMPASQANSFELTTALLRLDRYDNVKYSAILDNNMHAVEMYVGQALVSKQDIDAVLAKDTFNNYKIGTHVVNGDIVAFQHIGEKTLPQGYLLIVNDALVPLEASKRKLLYRVLPLTILVILIGILLSSWQHYRLLLPMKKLAELARKIKQTNDYSINLEIEGKREVKDLSDEINSMMHTIDHESTINKQYTEKLKSQQEAMEYMANFDSLTGLPNRHKFLQMVKDDLAQVKASNQEHVLMYCDLDNFKAVNDLHGHETGDHLLVAVSQRLKEHLGDGDIVSRIGGDEFLILLTQDDAHCKISNISEKVLKSLSAPFIIKDWVINVSASVGVSFSSQASDSVTKLIANADIAMYQAKLKGKNTFAVFESHMMKANKRRIDIASAIPRALENEELSLHYQAKVNRFDQTVGFEALIRWNSAVLGHVSPAEFIPIAEQSGKISLITRWVIGQVCQDITQLKQKFGEHIVIALNLSANDLKDPALLNVIYKAFATHSVTPKSIEFEVTESAFLENFTQANEFFDKLTELGCSVALDDFGTGYSSLSYLTKIKLNTLKIDKQFIDGLGVSERTSLITRTIVDMARNLSLKVCAEGVETSQQKALLIDMQCDQMQGYLFAKPQPIATLMQQDIKASNISELSAFGH